MPQQKFLHADKEEMHKVEIKPEMERERQKPVKLVTGICFLMEINSKTYNPRKFYRLSGTQFGMVV